MGAPNLIEGQGLLNGLWVGYQDDPMRSSTRWQLFVAGSPGKQKPGIQEA